MQYLKMNRSEKKPPFFGHTSVDKIILAFENNYSATGRKNLQGFPDKITRKHIAVAFSKSYM